MTKAKFNLMVRVIKNRMSDGEAFEDIIADYPKLTEDEIKQLREAVGA